MDSIMKRLDYFTIVALDAIWKELINECVGKSTKHDALSDYSFYCMEEGIEPDFPVESPPPSSLPIPPLIWLE
jgi:hypothetical protein